MTLFHRKIPVFFDGRNWKLNDFQTLLTTHINQIINIQILQIQFL